MDAKKRCKLANIAANNTDPQSSKCWQQFVGPFISKKGEAEYLGWKVMVCFTTDEEICFIFAIHKSDENTRIRKPYPKFILISELKNIQISPG